MVTAVAASNTRTQHHRQGSIVGSLAITTALNGRRGLRERKSPLLTLGDNGALRA